MQQGTLPYMAVEILEGSAAHRFDHDLESVFFVMCYLFATSAGPDGLKREDFILKYSSFAKWFGDEKRSSQDIADSKSKMCETSARFERDILIHLSPYFDCLPVRDCLEDLRRLLFTPPLMQEELDASYPVCDVTKKTKRLYRTPRINRDPDEFCNEFKAALQTAYERLDKEEPAPNLSVVSSNNISALSQAEAEVLWRPIDLQDAQPNPESPRAPVGSSQQYDPVRAGPSDSGVGIDSISTLKRKSGQDLLGAGSVPVKRSRLDTTWNEQSPKFPAVEPVPAEGDDVQMADPGLDATGVTDAKTTTNGSRQMKVPSTRRPQRTHVPVPGPAGDIGEPETSNRRVTRSMRVSKTNNDAATTSKKLGGTKRRVIGTEGDETRSHHRYPTRYRTKSQGASVTVTFDNRQEQQVVADGGRRPRTRSQAKGTHKLTRNVSVPNFK